jgi:hypothetical protein
MNLSQKFTFIVILTFIVLLYKNKSESSVKTIKYNQKNHLNLHSNYNKQVLS